MKLEAADVKKIILEREDGTMDVITRGFVADYSRDADADTGVAHFDICNLYGSDVGMIIASMLKLGAELGMFGDLCANEEDEEDEG